MKFTKCFPALAALGGFLLTAGCGLLTRSALPERAEIIAKYTSTPISIDGKLEDKAWTLTPSYPLFLGKQAYAKLSPALRRTLGTNLKEKGECKLLWDNDYLYVGIKFMDSDVVAEGEKDQMYHYNTGDVAEVFIKPQEEAYYWELYVTPANKKSCFFFPGRGRLFLPSCQKENLKLETAAAVSGSLNNWQDQDHFWTAEMAIPVKSLVQYGAEFGPGSRWNFFVSRYNYSKYLQYKELSSFPQQDEPNFHVHEEYGLIKFLP